MTIRTHPVIQGITVGSIENHIELYADDVILFLKNLAQLFTALLEFIKTVCMFSGYKMNNNEFNVLHLMVFTTFQNSPEGFIYLGIKITPKIEQLVYLAGHC